MSWSVHVGVCVWQYNNAAGPAGQGPLMLGHPFSSEGRGLSCIG